MKHVAGSQVREAILDASALTNGLHSLRLDAEDPGANLGADEIRILMGDHAEQQRVARHQDNSLKAWPQHDLPATQLGPDNKGRNW